MFLFFVHHPGIFIGIDQRGVAGRSALELLIGHQADLVIRTGG